MIRTTSGRPAPMVIIGIGNSMRGDDGVGLLVARKIRKSLRQTVRVVEESGEGTRLMEAWKGSLSAILIDAVSGGSAPGTIHRIDASSGRIPAALFHRSSHAFGLAEAIALATSLNRLPERVVIYGIEGADFGHGAEMSAAVRHAADEVASRILEDIRPEAIQNIPA